MGGSNWLDYVSFQDWLPYFDDPNAGHSAATMTCREYVRMITRKRGYS